MKLLLLLRFIITCSQVHLSAGLFVCKNGAANHHSDPDHNLQNVMQLWTTGPVDMQHHHHNHHRH